MPKKSTVGELASAATVTDFAEQLSSYTTLTADEIATLFPKTTDRVELMELLKIVGADADDKEKKAQLVARIDSVGGAVLKIVKKFAPGL